MQTLDPAFNFPNTGDGSTYSTDSNNEFAFPGNYRASRSHPDDTGSENSDLGFINTISELLNIVAVPSNDTDGSIKELNNFNKYWAIKHSEVSTFWNNYCNLLHQRHNPLYLAEVAGKTIPVIGRLKFRFSPRAVGQMPSQICDEILIPSLVQIYQSALDSCLHYTEDDGILFIAVTTISPAVYQIEEDNQIKGELELRIHFPYCTVSHNTAKLIRLQVLEYLQEENVFSHFLQFQPINTWTDIISQVGPKEVMPFYGSTEKESIPPPTLNQIYQIIEEDHLNSHEFEIMNLEDAFFPGNHGHVRDGLIVIPDTADKFIWLPMFLSLHHRNKVFSPKNSGRDSENESRNSNEPSLGEYDEQKLHERQEFARQFLDMIKTSRYGNPYSLSDILKATYNSFDGSDEGLQLVCQHVTRAGKMDINQCREDYYKMDINNYLDIKTLAYYAKLDNPMKYNTWHQKWYSAAFDQALAINHQLVAEAFYRLYWLKFLYDGKVWYIFDHHHWMRAEHGIAIKDYITGEFTACFKQLRTKYSAQINNCNDPKEEAVGEIILAKIEKLIDRLGNGEFINQVTTRLAQGFYYERDMKLKFHHNDWVLGVKNGVLEFSKTGKIFRDGKPQDYIKVQVPTPFMKDYHWKHPSVVEVKTWFSQMFTDPELFHYFFKLTASMMVARNRDKIFVILEGKGNNSKSMLKKLLEYTFGERAPDVSVTLITRKRGSSSGPQPELADMEYALIVLMDEPDSDDRIPDGQLKKLASTDSFRARTLNEHGGKCQARFVMWMITNEIPEMDNTQAMASRVLIVPFMSRWVWSEDAPEDPKVQSKLGIFPMDINFEDKIPHMTKAFLWIIGQYYDNYCTEGLSKRPAVVQNRIDNFWRKRDTYLKFIDESIEKVYANEDRTELTDQVTLPIDQAYAQYKTWMDNYHGNNVNKPNRDEFVEKFSSKIKIYPTNGGWLGLRILTTISAI